MQTEQVMAEATLCLLVRCNSVLLAIKTRKIGAGKFNGFGGGIEDNETRLESAVRELFTESTLMADQKDLEKAAVLYCYNQQEDGSVFFCKVHVYLLRKWLGKAEESEEMIEPTWFPIDNLPFHDMMLADPYWMPQVLAGKKVIVTAHYGPFQQTLLQPVHVEEVEGFDEASL